MALLEEKSALGLIIYNAICSLVLRRGFLIRCAILVLKYSGAFRGEDPDKEIAMYRTYEQISKSNIRLPKVSIALPAYELPDYVIQNNLL